MEGEAIGVRKIKNAIIILEAPRNVLGKADIISDSWTARVIDGINGVDIQNGVLC